MTRSEGESEFLKIYNAVTMGCRQQKHPFHARKLVIRTGTLREEKRIPERRADQLEGEKESLCALNDALVENPKKGKGTFKWCHFTSVQLCWQKQLSLSRLFASSDSCASKSHDSSCESSHPSSSPNSGKRCFDPLSSLPLLLWCPECVHLPNTNATKREGKVLAPADVVSRRRHIVVSAFSLFRLFRTPSQHELSFPLSLSLYFLQILVTCIKWKQLIRGKDWLTRGADLFIFAPSSTLIPFVSRIPITLWVQTWGEREGLVSN